MTCCGSCKNIYQFITHLKRVLMFSDTTFSHWNMNEVINPFSVWGAYILEPYLRKKCILNDDDSP